jgi:hypothetical protein
LRARRGGRELPRSCLRAPIAAGTWRLVSDGIVIEPVDVRFQILWRHADGSDDTELAAFTQHFDPLGGGVYRAQAYEQTAQVDAVEAVDGDALVLRYTGESASLGMAYIPNGDGASTGGRIPFIELPH